MVWFLSGKVFGVLWVRTSTVLISGSDGRWCFLLLFPEKQRGSLSQPMHVTEKRRHILWNWTNLHQRHCIWRCKGNPNILNYLCTYKSTIYWLLFNLTKNLTIWKLHTLLCNLKAVYLLVVVGMRRWGEKESRKHLTKFNQVWDNSLPLTLLTDCILASFLLKMLFTGEVLPRAVLQPAERPTIQHRNSNIRTLSQNF